MQIREIAVSHYGPLRDVKHQPRPGLQVFFGPNESGKTLLIDAALKLMLGSRLKDFTGIDRVSGNPLGRVVLADQGSEHILDGKTRLDTVTGLDSNHLRNVFVIRNKDLQINGQADFLRRINDQLTGMESRRLEELKKILSKQGRLTSPSSTARLSKSAEFSKIGEHVETAEKLSGEIQEYISEARARELDSLERRLEDSRQGLAAVNGQIQNQEQAEKWQDYSTLAALVKEYEEREEATRALLPFTKTSFMRLQELDSRSQAARETARDSKDKLELLKPRLEGAQAKLAETKAQMAPQESRKSRLDYLEQETLVAAKTPPPPVTGILSRFSFALAGVAALGLVLAAMNLLPSWMLAIPLAAVAGAVALALADQIARTKAQEHRRRDKTLLQEGAASGIMAATLQELAAAVASEKNGLEIARFRQQQLADTVRDMEQQQLHLEENIRAANGRADDLAMQVKQELQRLGVPTLEEFGTLMEKYSLAQAQCDELYQRLEDRFGQIPVHTGKWCDLLQQLPVPENPGLAFDRTKLARLREQKDEAAAQIDSLLGDLTRHQAKLNHFASICQGLPLEQDTGYTLPPRFANLEMLEYADTVLNRFAAAVKARVETACKALAVLEDLELEEREKMTALLGADKPVQKIFSTITNGSYVQVLLDSDLNIRVQNKEGLELPASSLSQGTFDQLYLALRLSLAHDILAGTPGFLLMDDAFLCADSDRLERMLAVLEGLAEQGWHILYFTMDERLLKAVPRFTGNSVIRLHSLLKDSLV